MNWRAVRRRLAPAMLGVAIGALALCGSGMSKADDSAGLTIGLTMGRPGLSDLGSDGRPAGFEVDVAQYLARALGVGADRVSFEEVPAGRLVGLLNAGNIDFAMAALPSDGPVAFAGPYLTTGQDLLVRAGARIAGPESLRGKSVCAVSGADPRIDAHFPPGTKLYVLPTYAACAHALLKRDVDAVTADDVVLAGLAAPHRDKLRLVGRPFTQVSYGVALRRGDISRRQRITSAIAAMIADGTWRQLMSEHLSATGFTPMPPPTVFAAPDVPFAPIAGSAPEPALTAAVDRFASAWNVFDWSTVEALVTPDARPAVTGLIRQRTPALDATTAPNVPQSIIAVTPTAVIQTGPTTALAQVRETYLHAQAPDITYTAGLTKSVAQWQLLSLSPSFPAAPN